MKKRRRITAFALAAVLVMGMFGETACRHRSPDPVSENGTETETTAAEFGVSETQMAEEDHHEPADTADSSEDPAEKETEKTGNDTGGTAKKPESRPASDDEETDEDSVSDAAESFGDTDTGIGFIEFPGWYQAKGKTVSNDFSLSVELDRMESDSGLFFYADKDRQTYFCVRIRWMGANRTDFYASRYCGGVWEGFLIPEEYQTSKQDCYVSDQHDWDTTADSSMILSVSVSGDTMRVTMTGTVTGKSGSLTYDLGKPAYLAGVYSDDTAPLPKTGAVGVCANGEAEVSFRNFTIGDQPGILDTAESILPGFTGFPGWYQAEGVTVENDFGMSVELDRMESDSGLFFYADEDRQTYFCVRIRWMGASRTDFYASRYCGGVWEGFLIPEEYQTSKQDCYVSDQHDWDTTADSSMVLSISVTGNTMRVTMTGTATGKSGSLTYDLGKPAYLAGVYSDDTTPLPKTGAVGVCANGEAEVSFRNFMTGAAEDFVVAGAVIRSLSAVGQPVVSGSGSAGGSAQDPYVWRPAGGDALEGDFNLSVVLDRGEKDCGVFFYADKNRKMWYCVRIRWVSAERTDFYASRYDGGTWEGFLIPEEYQESRKDCYVSVDEEWDTTADSSMTLRIAVTGDIMRATMIGTSSGKFGTLTFDLTKPPYRDGKYSTNYRTIPRNGTAGVFADGGTNVSFRDLKVEDTPDTPDSSEEPGTAFVEFPGWYQASDVAVENDFELTAELWRMSMKKDCGVFFYADEERQTYFSVMIRWVSAARTDFYVSRTYGGVWEGFLIPEEYQASKQDCYVSDQHDWDTTEDASMRLDISVVGDTMKVTMTGTTSGKSGTLTYDLGEPAYLGGYNGNTAQLPKTGAVGVCASEPAKVWFRNFEAKDMEDTPDMPEEPGIDFVVSPGWYQADKITVEKDLKMSVKLDRMDSDCGVFFYADEERQTYFSVMIRWIGANRTDFYASRYCGGVWEGFLIPEEYQASKQDCYVSDQHDWDTTADSSMVLSVSISGDTMRVTMTGTATGKSGSLTYDLGKPAYLAGVYSDDTAPLPKTGAVGVCANGEVEVSFRNFTLEDTPDMPDTPDPPEEPGITFVESPVGWYRADGITVNEDFKLSVELDRMNTDCGVFFYADEERQTYFSVMIRLLNAARTDFYASRYRGGIWEGFLIAEEYQESKKDCYVSTDEWWDTTEDSSLILDVSVTGDFMTVKMTGTTSKKSGTLNYDLSKPALNSEDREPLPKTGAVGVCANGAVEVSFRDFSLEDTPEVPLATPANAFSPVPLKLPRDDFSDQSGSLPEDEPEIPPFDVWEATPSNAQPSVSSEDSGASGDETREQENEDSGEEGRPEPCGELPAAEREGPPLFRKEEQDE